MRKKDLLSETRAALLEIAGELGVKGRTRMTKTELARAILNRRNAEGRGGEAERPPARQRRRAPIREKDLVRRSWREQQAAVQHAKFEVGVVPVPRPPEAPVERPAERLEEFPPPGARDKIVLMVRDPYWVFAYWDVSEETLGRARAALGGESDGVRRVLRVYDVTGVDFDGGNANSFSDIAIGGEAADWYINTGAPRRTFVVDIGLLSHSGRFLTLARSNKAATPSDSPSDSTEDEQYMIPDWEFDKIYALSGGFTFDSGSGSIELKELIEKALAVEVGSGAPGSMNVASPGARIGKGRGFWFRVGTELIVYGATEPGARVTVQGRPVDLRPDGTFTLRFALPEGVQVIPATAESADGVDRITWISTVEKSTAREDT